MVHNHGDRDSPNCKPLNRDDRRSKFMNRCNRPSPTLYLAATFSCSAWCLAVNTQSEKTYALTCSHFFRKHMLQLIQHVSTLAPQRRAIFPPFLDLWTSKSGPYPSVFWHFDFEMCFSPQRRAIFPHRNFKKWSAPDSFLAFWLENVLLATAACNFSRVLCRASSAPAALARLLFDPADTQNIEKHSISRLP